MSSSRITAAGALCALWGGLGVIGILVFAIYRLTPIAMTAILDGLGWFAWTVLAANVAFMAWSEGYKGFQLRFSPRVAARTLYLARNPGWVNGILAPLFCIGYYCASKRGLIAAWIGTLAIVILVLLVHQLVQPWRGILDAGVVVGLSWGLASFVYSLQQAFVTGEYARSPELSPELSAKLSSEASAGTRPNAVYTDKVTDGI